MQRLALLPPQCEIIARFLWTEGKKRRISDECEQVQQRILGVGADDTTLDLFESQYPVPAGVSNNSHVILDEKVAVLDTVDARATDAWLENLSQALAGRMPDYLVVST